MHFRTVSTKTSLGAAIRSVQTGQRQRTVVGDGVQVSRTTRGTVLRVKRRTAEDTTARAAVPRYA
jgi:hypothetical protein